MDSMSPTTPASLRTTLETMSLNSFALHTKYASDEEKNTHENLVWKFISRTTFHVNLSLKPNAKYLHPSKYY